VEPVNIKKLIKVNISFFFECVFVVHTMEVKGNWYSLVTNIL